MTTSDDESVESEIEEDLRGLETFVEDNAENAAVIAKTAVEAPFEITFSLFSDMGMLILAAGVGVVWVLTWMVTVAFAAFVLSTMDSLMGFFIIIAEIFDIIADAWQVLFAVVFYIVQFVACEFPLISEAIGPSKKGICSQQPGLNLEVIPTDKDWWKTDAWRAMYELETTCK